MAGSSSCLRLSQTSGALTASETVAQFQVWLVSEPETVVKLMAGALAEPKAVLEFIKTARAEHEAVVKYGQAGHRA